MWTARATSYRHERGFDHAAARLAVVVQTMVESEVSGVMFTGNPLTTATDEIVVNASYGLGEAIVAGIVTPDQFVIDFDTSRVKEQVVGSKAVRIVRDPVTGTGTVTEDVPPALAGRPSLSADQLAGLADLGRRVQEQYGGFPQDIEWGISGGTLHLLQSRPVTGVEFSWDADVEEGNINHTVEDDYIWTRQWADMLTTGGVTPLTYSIRYAYSMSVCWNHMANCADVNELVGMRLWKYHKGELYYNCLWEKVWLEKTVWPHGRMAEHLMMVPKPWHDEIKAAPFSLLKYVRGLIKTQLVDPDVLGFRKVLPSWHANRAAEAHGLTYEELAKLSDKEVKRYTERTIQLEIDHGNPVVMALLMHMRDAMNLLALMLDRWYGPDPQVFAKLISGCRTRTGTQVENIKLWEIAKIIHDSPALTRVFGDNPGAGFFTACEASDEGRAFLERYRAFEAEYYFRGHSDRDMIYDRRREDPGLDYNSLATLLNSDFSITPDDREREVNERREALFDEVVAAIRGTPLGGLKAEALKWAFVQVHDYIVLRDDERQFPNDATVYAYKRGFIEMGRRLTARGLLDSEHDVHYLSWQEVYQLLDGNTSKLPLMRAKVAARRRDVKRRHSHEAPMPKYLVRNRAADIDTADAGDGSGALRGMGTSSGLVTGRARVVKSLAEIGRVQRGEILVTNSTDPGWTPVFLTISGVVVETGGVLSHSSLLAREYGFPAVLLENAMALIPDGAEITVNGDAGTVVVTEPEVDTEPADRELVDA
jgi:pyruvate,water dikinase